MVTTVTFATYVAMTKIVAQSGKNGINQKNLRGERYSLENYWIDL